MANAADEAQMIEEADRQAGLLRIQKQIRRGEVLETADNCDECGEKIPRARQALHPGVRHCTACAENLERRLNRPRMVFAI